MTEDGKALEDRFQLETYRKYPMVVERGEDVWIYTDSGERYLDLYGGHAVAITGHCHPRLVQTIREQAEKLIFYSNLVYIPARASASRMLVEMSPPGLHRAFFVNSGAEAIENALKLARKVTGRPGIISFRGGFHGRTIGALSATGMEQYRTPFHPRVSDHYFASFGDLDGVSSLMNGTIAGILLEPIQSMAGVVSAPADFYQGLRKLCDEWGSVLIYDEIQTGVGRTGEMFFAPRYGVTPNILAVAKGLASGIPIGAVLVDEWITSGVQVGDLGSTFGGGPLACAALTATLEIIQQENLLENVREQSWYLREKLRGTVDLEGILGLGFLIGLRFKRPASELQAFLFEQKILTGLSSDPYVLRLLPPLTLRKRSIDYFVEVLKQWN